MDFHYVITNELYYIKEIKSQKKIQNKPFSNTGPKDPNNDCQISTTVKTVQE